MWMREGKITMDPGRYRVAFLFKSVGPRKVRLDVWRKKDAPVWWALNGASWEKRCARGWMKEIVTGTRVREEGVIADVEKEQNVLALLKTVWEKIELVIEPVEWVRRESDVVLRATIGWVWWMIRPKNALAEISGQGLFSVEVVCDTY
jgi:hypothetical protein